MECAGARDSLGEDLSALADALSQSDSVLVIYVLDLVLAEDTNLFLLAVRTERALIFSLIHLSLRILS